MMTARQRVLAAISGERPDRTPVSFWKHFPEHDERADLLAEAMVMWRNRFDLDVVKMMSSGSYAVEDYGAKIGSASAVNGAKPMLEGPFQRGIAWDTLPVLTPDRPARARELEAIRLTRRALGPDVPILATVFSPLSTAVKLGGRDAVFERMKSEPAVVHALLRTLTESEKLHAAAAVEAGADGLFYATQLCGARAISDADHETFNKPYDLDVLSAIRGKSSISMLHLHGDDLSFARFFDYALPLVNWHDRRTSPRLLEGRTQWTHGAVCGGLDESNVLLTAPPKIAATDVKAMLRQSEGMRHILTPGCVLPMSVLDDVLDAVRGAVEV
jgi:uroporphyrinogen decarboxylase